MSPEESSRSTLHFTLGVKLVLEPINEVLDSLYLTRIAIWMQGSDKKSECRLFIGNLDKRVSE